MRAPALLSVCRAVVGTLAAVALALTVTLLGSGSASAAGGSSVAPYPPSACATLAVSSTTGAEGGPIQVTGTGYLMNAQVAVVLTQGSNTWILAHVTTSSTGRFQTTVTLPTGVTGEVTISTTGGTPTGCVLDPVLVSISAAAGPVAGGSGGGAAPASTGVNVEAMLLLAGILLAVGIPMALMQRRTGRRTVHRRKRGNGPAIFLPPHRSWDGTA